MEIYARSEVRDWPVVVGGCPRSGTTLMSRLLDGHSRIHCGPEVKFFRDFHGHYFKDELSHLRYTQSARSMLPEDELLEVLGRGFVEVHERAARRAGKERWADKNPDNARYIEGWDRLLGDRWLYVHMLRDPADTIASMDEAGFHLSIPQDLEGRIELYRALNTLGLDHVAASPDRACWVRYRSLAREPERIMKHLMAWLGEAFEPGQLDLEHGADGEGLGDPKIRETQSVHSGSVERGERVLGARDVEAIRRATRDLMKRTEGADASWDVGK